MHIILLLLWFFGPFPGHGLPCLNKGFKGVFYWVRLTLCQTANLQEQDIVLGFTTIGTCSVWLLCWGLFSFGDHPVSYTAAGTAPNNLPAQYRAKLLRKYMPRIPAISKSDANEVRYAKDRHAGTSTWVTYIMASQNRPLWSTLQTKGSMKFSSTESSSCWAHGKIRYRDKVMSQQFQQVQRVHARPNLAHTQTDPGFIPWASRPSTAIFRLHQRISLAWDIQSCLVWILEQDTLGVEKYQNPDDGNTAGLCNGVSENQRGCHPQTVLKNSSTSRTHVCEAQIFQRKWSWS
jgi:hypothetical protein